MKFILKFVFAAGLLVGAISTASAADGRPNVVLMMADDLGTQLGCYDYPQAKTPHLDRLGRRGIIFARAYCQFPLCNPSRASMMSGLRPNTTRVTTNADNLYTNVPGVVTLPRAFRQGGYTTARFGKIFHLGVPNGRDSMDDSSAWDFGTPFKDERPFPSDRPTDQALKESLKNNLPWSDVVARDDDMMDGALAAKAVAWLENRDQDKPFFLAVGFHRPHLPLVAPVKYFDLYPMESIKLPKEPKGDISDIPLPARNESLPGYAFSATPEQRRAVIRAYLASVSYMDAQAGRVLETLERLGLAENTIIVFTSDHGWHLGEHGLWQKRSLFEESARVPLIMAGPGVHRARKPSQSLVELLDVYPTLCDLTGVPTPAAVQGKSLRPLLSNPKATIHDAVFSQARRGPKAEYWGRSVRTSRWRCTEWNEGRDGIELYDHRKDPGEFTNLADDPRHAGTLKELRSILAAKVPSLQGK